MGKKTNDYYIVPTLLRGNASDNVPASDESGRRSGKGFILTQERGNDKSDNNT